MICSCADRTHHTGRIQRNGPQRTDQTGMDQNLYQLK